MAPLDGVGGGGGAEDDEHAHSSQRMSRALHGLVDAGKRLSGRLFSPAKPKLEQRASFGRARVGDKDTGRLRV
eukprot:7324791-Prymnesium_polylepis.1